MIQDMMDHQEVSVLINYQQSIKFAAYATVKYTGYIQLCYVCCLNFELHYCSKEQLYYLYIVHSQSAVD